MWPGTQRVPKDGACAQSVRLTNCTQSIQPSPYKHNLFGGGGNMYKYKKIILHFLEPCACLIMLEVSYPIR